MNLWNPNVVSILNEGDGIHCKAFLKKYNEASGLLLSLKGAKSGFKYALPLAFRLDPVTEAAADDLHASKFGGRPDLTYWYEWDSRHYSVATDLLQQLARLNVQNRADEPRRLALLGQIAEVKASLDAEAVVRGIWPRCGVCHERASFIGQLDFTPWKNAIHKLTCVEEDGWATSPLGNDRHESQWTREWWLVFACLEPHYRNPNYAACILKDRRSTYGDDMDDKPDDEAVYLEAVRKVTPQQQHPILRVTGYELRFDLDPSRESEALVERMMRLAEDHPELFGRHTTDFALFGSPKSQQTPARYYGGQGYGSPYRLTPFLSWGAEGDVTHQLYADLYSADDWRAYGRLDSSGT